MAQIDRLLLTFLGVLIAHEVAYLTSALAGYENSIAHGHLRTAWLIGSASLLSLVARALLTSLRRRNFAPGNPALLAGSIAGGYFVVETVERLVDGYSVATLFGEPVFWLGLAVAPLVAVLLSRSLESLEALATKLVGERHDRIEAQPATCSLAATSVPSFSTVLLSSSVSLRGPPSGLSFQ